MSERRGYWYLLTGVLLGLALGIVFAWLVSPLEYTDTSPDSLRADFKDEYRYLIAASYKVHGNLDRTLARLSLLGDPDPAVALGEQAQRYLAADAPVSAARVLADLAEVLQNPQTLPQESVTQVSLVDPAATVATLALGDQPVATLLPTDATSPFEPILGPTDTPTLPPTATQTLTLRPGARTATVTRTPQRSPTPIATVTAKPSLTPTATPGLPFQLIEQSTFCDSERPALLEVILEDASGKPASGIEIVITWLGGDESFFTGLKPELGFGYADFEMNPGVEYALSLSNGITRISGLQASTCTGESENYPGGIRLEFRQP
ncbi:MAG: hypothetical protein L6461_06320 [Anaerolineae bacterium]|nr:hypothetical protein [Anaerolineae bacterium]